MALRFPDQEHRLPQEVADLFLIRAMGWTWAQLDETPEDRVQLTRFVLQEIEKNKPRPPGGR